MMQSDQQVPEPAERGAVIPIVRARLGQELREYYPEVVFLEIDSRLGRVVERLSGALDAAEAEGQVRAGFKDALIGALPRLRRYALALT
ncbi:RNA polymerase subunit sigma-24, partial [Methylobacterium hispanicum]